MFRSAIAGANDCVTANNTVLQLASNDCHNWCVKVDGGIASQQAWLIGIATVVDDDSTDMHATLPL